LTFTEIAYASGYLWIIVLQLHESLANCHGSASVEIILSPLATMAFFTGFAHVVELHYLRGSLDQCPSVFSSGFPAVKEPALTSLLMCRFLHQ